MKTKVLDCTLRDGGYYTHWDFPRNIVDKYLDTVADLPIDYIEIGYRSSPKEDYFGEYFYTPIETINRISKKLGSSKKIAIMINTKDIANVQELESLLRECKGKVHLVRFAVAPNNMQNASIYAKKVKQLGFEAALNLMYLSQMDSQEIISQVNYILDYVEDIDYIYLVDSYGACLPSEIMDKFKSIIKEHENLALGFHGHDNIQLAYANTLEAIDAGAGIIDATVTGMGRGAGNLSTELICSYFASKENVELDYTNLVDLVEVFNELKVKYGWGTSLPYMISGLNKLPQGEVMDLISLNRYSTNNIVSIINNKIQDNAPIKNSVSELPSSEFKDFDFSVLIGGGASVITHINALENLNNKFKILFIHSTTKHLELFKNKGFNNLVCLPGDESKKVKSYNNKENEGTKFVILNDSEIDEKSINSNIYAIGSSKIDELLEIKEFAKDAPLFIALKVTEILSINNFYLIGFDGYDEETKTTKILRDENQIIINSYSKKNKKIVSFTPSKYDIEVKSLYSISVHGV